jgi:hypothetical protein
MDNDQLLDGEEVHEYKTDPKKSDTDNDELSDYQEVHEYTTNPLKSDTDDDKLSDKKEIELGLNPKNPDMDNDQLLDGDELSLGLDTRNPDYDKDGLLDGEEVHQYKTDPFNPDSDGDGLLDGKEAHGTTDPNNPDTDGDGVNDSQDAVPGVKTGYLFIPLWIVLLVSLATGASHYVYGLTTSRREKIAEKKVRSATYLAFYERERETIISLAEKNYGWIAKEDIIKLGADEQCAEICLKKLGAKKKDELYHCPDIERKFVK